MSLKPLKTEKDIVSKFESLREERDDLANQVAVRSSDLQASQQTCKLSSSTVLFDR